MSRRTFDANHAPVQFDEALHQRESEARALPASAGSLAELLEDDPLLGRIDADAAISHEDLDRAFFERTLGGGDGARGDRYRGALWRELHGVGHEVVEDLLDERRVGLEHRHVFRNLDLDIDPAQRRHALHHRADSADHLAKQDRLRMNLHASGFDLGEVEDVVDDAEEIFARRVNVVQKPAVPRIEIAGDVGDEDLRESDDGVERRAQLVTRRRQEDALRAIRFLGLRERLLRELLVTFSLALRRFRFEQRQLGALFFFADLTRAVFDETLQQARALVREVQAHRVRGEEQRHDRERA